MWQNRDGLSNDLVLNKDNMNFNDNSDLNNPKTSISPYYQQTQEPIPFNDGLIKASNTVNEIGTQAQSGIFSFFLFNKNTLLRFYL